MHNELKTSPGWVSLRRGWKIYISKLQVFARTTEPHALLKSISKQNMAFEAYMIGAWCMHDNVIYCLLICHYAPAISITLAQRSESLELTEAVGLSFSGPLIYSHVGSLRNPRMHVCHYRRQKPAPDVTPWTSGLTGWSLSRIEPTHSQQTRLDAAEATVAAGIPVSSRYD